MLNHYYNTEKFQSLPTQAKKTLILLKPQSVFGDTRKQMQGEKRKPHLVLVATPFIQSAEFQGAHLSAHPGTLKVSEVEVFIKAHA